MIHLIAYISTTYEKIIFVNIKYPLNSMSQKSYLNILKASNKVDF